MPLPPGSASSTANASVADPQSEPLVLPFSAVGIEAVERVGGKNASLGEMIRELAGQGVRVPDGFATTAAAYRHFITGGGLGDRLHELLDDLDGNDIAALQA
ncbi:MAG: PEP/pyruvate-binding domain-containing protein, partial [Synechococcaceae cyanobacterium]